MEDPEEQETGPRPEGDAEGRTWREYGRLTIRFLGVYWKSTFAVVWALFPIPLLLTFDQPEVRCGYVVTLMAGYWVTECIPIPITSIFPVVLLPVLSIMSTADTCACYMNDTIMVFIGGLILAIATEHSNLHLRIALFVMNTLGCSHAKLLAGLCTVTCFISMWIANAAATAMMVPIVFAVLEELERQGIGRVFITLESDPKHPEIEPEIIPTKVTRAYLLAAAYASSFGGTGSLVGTPTNLAFKGIFENTFPKAPPITFGIWLSGSFPQMCVNTFILWIYLRVAYLGLFRPNSTDAALAAIGEEEFILIACSAQMPHCALVRAVPMTSLFQVIRTKLKSLGPMTFHESAVAVLFAFCIFMWIFRAPGFVDGWAIHVSNIKLADSVPALFACIAMFFIPKEPNFLFFCTKDRTVEQMAPSEGLMTWVVIEKKMPWRLIFLLGGGFAISRATRVSGLAILIGRSLVALQDLNPILMLAIVLFAVANLTEFTSNVGTANIVLPVVAHLCVAMRIHPLYLMIPVSIMCSYAFRIPVATPPNAIITVAGHMPSRMLIAAGCIPGLYSWLVNVLLFPTWGTLIFDTRRFPEWAEDVRVL